MSFRPENIIPGIILCFIFELLLDLSKPTKTLSKKKNFLPGKLQERDFVSTNAEQDLKMGISPNVIAYSTVMKAFIRAKKFDK
ncbi:hypothetical protein SCA6_013936, partial [Theobroma cacao]